MFGIGKFRRSCLYSLHCEEEGVSHRFYGGKEVLTRVLLGIEWWEVLLLSGLFLLLGRNSLCFMYFLLFLLSRYFFFFSTSVNPKARSLFGLGDIVMVFWWGIGQIRLKGWTTQLINIYSHWEQSPHPHHDMYVWFSMPISPLNHWPLLSRGQPNRE